MQWFSDNPSKAWAERFFLVYTPIWIAAVAAVQLTGWMKRWGDVGYLAFCVGVMLPLWLYPLLRPGEADRGRPFHRTYWFRFNLWIWIFVWIGSYFFSHYFFDVLGMRYRFPTTWNLDAALVGSDKGEVPFALYPLTQCYFVTYHTALVIALRGLKRRFRLGRVTTAALVVVLSYAVAWAETFFMANDMLRDYFWYVDRSRMLAYGSLFYASFFVVSAPMVWRLDEQRGDYEQPTWSLGRVAIEAFAAGMIVFIILDAWALILGPL